MGQHKKLELKHKQTIKIELAAITNNYKVNVKHKLSINYNLYNCYKCIGNIN